MRRILLSGVFLLSGALTACNSRPSRVVIGIALTKSMHPAVVLAAKEINARGGIDGVPLELAGLEWQVVDRFDAVDILKWANRFAETEDLLAVIGHSDSTSTISAAAFYNRNRIPQIVTIATSPAITNIGQWTYRLCLSDAGQGPALAEYAVKEWGKKRIAVFYVNDEYGRGLAQLFERRIRELGGEIVASVLHRNVLQPDDQELIRATLSDLKNKGAPDLIALFQRVDAGSWTVRAVRDTGLKSDILGGDNLGSVNFLVDDPELKERIRLSGFFLTDRENPLSLQFEKNMLEFTQAKPDYGQAFAYDAVYLVRDAVLGGGFSREGVKYYLDSLIDKKTRLRGVAGAYSLGPDHDARRSFYIVEVHGGQHRFLKALRVD